MATLLAVPACASKQKSATASVAPKAAAAPPSGGAPGPGHDAAADGDGVAELAFRPIYFAYDRADLDDSARTMLADGASELKRRAGARVRVAGHTDERGTEEYNMALGDRRANAAKSYLVGLGVEAARIEAVSFGETRPAVPGTDEAAWAKNRRAELELTSR